MSLKGNTGGVQCVDSQGGQDNQKEVKLKLVLFKDLKPYTRFIHQEQWWVKVNGYQARHASYDTVVDVGLKEEVVVREDSDAPAYVPKQSYSSSHYGTSTGRKNSSMRKAQVGLLVALFDWLSSLG